MPSSPARPLTRARKKIPLPNEAGLVQSVAAASQGRSQGDCGIEVLQFGLELLVDQQQRLQRAVDVAIAAGHDFVDGRFLWSESHRRTSNCPLDKPLASGPRSCGLRGKVGQKKPRWHARARLPQCGWR